MSVSFCCDTIDEQRPLLAHSRQTRDAEGLLRARGSCWHFRVIAK